MMRTTEWAGRVSWAWGVHEGERLEEWFMVVDVVFCGERRVRLVVYYEGIQVDGRGT